MSRKTFGGWGFTPSGGVKGYRPYPPIGEGKRRVREGMERDYHPHWRYDTLAALV